MGSLVLFQIWRTDAPPPLRGGRPIFARDDGGWDGISVVMVTSHTHHTRVTSHRQVELEELERAVGRLVARRVGRRRRRHAAAAERESESASHDRDSRNGAAANGAAKAATGTRRRVSKVGIPIVIDFGDSDEGARDDEAPIQRSRRSSLKLGIPALEFPCGSDGARGSSGAVGDTTDNNTPLSNVVVASRHSSLVPRDDVSRKERPSKPLERNDIHGHPHRLEALLART